MPLIAQETTGTMISADGIVMGQCAFRVFRRKRNGPWLHPEDICRLLDHMSVTASRISMALCAHDEYDFVTTFNGSYLLVAERIEIQPEFRGGAKWKALYFATMRSAI